MWYVPLGDAIRAALGTRSQVWLADELGLDPGYLNRVLKGRQKPGEALLRQIANALAVPALTEQWLTLQRDGDAARKAKRQVARQRVKPAVDYADATPSTPIAERERKEATLRRLLQEHGIPLREARAILAGTGDNPYYRLYQNAA